MGTRPVRVVIAEDEPLTRRGIETVLGDGDGDFEVAASVGTAEDLLAAVGSLAPDLVITDIRMPPEFADEGLTAALEIRRTWPDVAVCVLSQHVLTRPARTLVDAGSSAGVGYLLKQRVTHIAEFLADLHRVVAGQVVLDPDVIEQVIDRADQAGTPVTRLTARQRDVLALVAEGRSNAGRSRRPCSSPRRRSSTTSLASTRPSVSCSTTTPIAGCRQSSPTCRAASRTGTDRRPTNVRRSDRTVAVA